MDAHTRTHEMKLNEKFSVQLMSRIRETAHYSLERIIYSMQRATGAKNTYRLTDPTRVVAINEEKSDQAIKVSG